MLLAFLVPGLARAQGGYYEGFAISNAGRPLGGATINVCATTATGTPCNPRSNIFSDVLLSVVKANPFAADSSGNYGFYAAPGLYMVQISAPGVPTTSFTVSVACIPNGTACGGSGTPGTPANSVQIANSVVTGFVGAQSLSYYDSSCPGGVAPCLISANPSFSFYLSNGAATKTTLNYFGLNVTDGTNTVNLAPGQITLSTLTVGNCLTTLAGKIIGDSGAPCGSGGSILASNNVFTGTNAFDNNVWFKGPNPYYDLTRFGLYTGSGAAITCTTTATSASVSCTSAGDFAVGQGIEIPGAGVASTFPTWGVTTISSYARSSNVATYGYSYVTGNPTVGPGQTITIAGLADSTFNGTFTVVSNDGNFGHFTVANTGSNLVTTAGSGTATLTSAQLTVTPQGILNGSTSYAYKVVLRGYNGELSAASSAGTTSTGAASLGANTATVTGCTRTSGLATCTTSATHNFQAGVSTDVEGESDIAFNGSHIIVATPTGSTFTFYQTGVADTTGSTGGTAKVVAKNMVRWNMQQYANIQAIIYRSINGGSYAIAGVEEGMDGAWVDWGLSAPTLPVYVPTTPPVSATNGILASTITAISGTTLTLATAATAAVSSVASQHDNVPNLLNACLATPSTTGGTIHIPVLNPVASIPFNSPLDFYHKCVRPQLVVEVGSGISINDPWIPNQSGLTVKAIPGSAASGLQFVSYYTSQVFGNAYPFFYVVPGSFGPFNLENMAMKCQQPYQSCVVQDQDAGGGGVVDMNYDNDYFIGNGGSMPFILRSGGFNQFFDRGAFVINTGTWAAPEALQITVPNALGIQPALVGFPYIVQLDKVFWVGHGIDYNDFGNVTTGVAGRITINSPLIESSYTPWLSLNLTGSSAFVGTTINNLNFADILSGPSTPVIDATNAARLGGISLNYSGCGNARQPLLAGNIIGGVQVLQGSTQGCSIIGASNVIATNLTANGATSQQYLNIPVQLSGTGEVFYSMPTPTSAPSVAATSGGAVPAGAHNYTVAAVDTAGNTTALSPAASITISGGTQTVTITPPTLPAGSVGYIPYRDGIKVNYGGVGCNGTYTLADTNFVDTLASLCGNLPPSYSTAGTTTIGSGGIGTYNMQITGGQGQANLGGTFTAPRKEILPDVNGIIPTSSYQNSLYDNFNRSNGAIGSNWTVTSGGFNVSSNTIIGTGATNLAAYSAGSWSTQQFAQVQTTTMNGTTDSVGVGVLLSGTNGYNCVENTTTLNLQKVTSGTGSNLATTSFTGAVGDLIRLEVTSSGVLTCTSKSLANVTTSITATDTTFTAGAPALEQFGTVATMDNWSGGNLHPIAQLDVEQDWTQAQRFYAGMDTNILDIETDSAPTNPKVNHGRLIFNGSTVSCLTSSGGNCLPGGGTVTNTGGTLTNNQLMFGAGGNDSKVGNLSGDTTTSGSGVTTTATVNGNPILHRAFIPAAGNNNGTCSVWWNTVLSAVAGGGTNVYECLLQFADTNTAQIPPIYLPPDWTGAIDVGLVFSDASTSGTVIFNVATACSPVNGTATDDTAFNAAQALNTVTLTTPANGQWRASLANITTTGCSAGQPLVLKFTRATDTAAGTVNVRGADVTYRSTNAL